MLTLLAQEGGGALSTYGQFRGMLAVATAVVLLIGLPMLILSTNVGVKKGVGVMLASLFGYLTIHGFLWMFYPRGPLVNTRNADGSRRTFAGIHLPDAIISRLPAILLMIGAGALTVILCFALNSLDKPKEEEPALKE